MRRFLPSLFVLPAAVAFYACSSDDSTTSDPTDSGVSEAGNNTEDGSTATDGSTKTDGGGDAGPGANPLPSSLAAANVISVSNPEGPIFAAGALFFGAYDDAVLVRLDPATKETTNPATDPAVTAKPLGMTIDGKANTIVRVQSSILPDQSTTGVFRFIADGGTGAPITTSFDGGTANWDSPNDIVVRTSDGTMYITDPGYQKEQADPVAILSNRIYQVTPTGAVIPAVTFATVDRPNGLALDKAQTTLFVSLTDAAKVVKYAVNANGSLGAQAPFATLATGALPDGIGMDDNGNVYVAETAGAGASGLVEVFKSDGTKWGAITLPSPATNVAFGGADRKTLYITANNGIYSIAVNVPGIQQ